MTRRPRTLERRTEVLARYLVAEGDHTADDVGTSHFALTDDVAYMVVGGTSLPHRQTVGQLLNQVTAKYPNRVPALIRTIHPEIEQAHITLRLADYVALTRRST